MKELEAMEDQERKEQEIEGMMLEKMIMERKFRAQAVM